MGRHVASSLTYAPQGAGDLGALRQRCVEHVDIQRQCPLPPRALQTQGQGGTTIQNFTYTYDPVGNITQIANTASTTNSATELCYDSSIASRPPPDSPPASIAIIDALPVTYRQSSTYVTSDSFTYTVPTGGTNKLLVVVLALP